MKIYVNEQYEILALDNPPERFYQCLAVERTREEMFGGLYDTCIRGYKYEPAYEMLFNEDGSNKRDPETGELLYRMDESGDRIQLGWQLYPYMDYNMLQLIQRQHEENQKEITELQLALADAYEQNLAMELSVTDTQLAIAQIYEGMEV